MNDNTKPDLRKSLDADKHQTIAVIMAIADGQLDEGKTTAHRLWRAVMGR